MQVAISSSWFRTLVNFSDHLTASSCSPMSSQTGGLGNSLIWGTVLGMLQIGTDARDVDSGLHNILMPVENAEPQPYPLNQNCRGRNLAFKKSSLAW